MTDPSDPTPERPDESDGSDGSDGQVSEVARLDPADADTPIQPSDSTAGYPESESGDPDVRGAGPDAVPPENRRDNDFKPRDHQLGERVEDV